MSGDRRLPTDHLVDTLTFAMSGAGGIGAIWWVSSSASGSSRTRPGVQESSTDVQEEGALLPLMGMRSILVRTLILCWPLALGASCVPPAVPCGPSSCFGCCDRNGECVSSNQEDSCGQAGLQCDVCVDPERCIAGLCRSVSPGGRGMGGVGGGAGGGVGGGG